MRIEPWYQGIPEAVGLHVRATEEIDLDWDGKLAFLNCVAGGVIDARFNTQFVEYEPVPYEVHKKLQKLTVNALLMWDRLRKVL